MLHQVGAGTLGPVFRAHDPAEGRLVAVKAFRLDLIPERVSDFAAALNALASRNLDHPSMAAPIGAGVQGATPWLAQAYVPAESLDAALRQYGPPPLGDALAILTALAGALDYAAAAGVLHGALHPRDVLVAPDDTRLVDLGVAEALETVGLRAPVRRPYTAPERIEGARASRAADVFSLGAIAFELVTGQHVAGAGDQAVAALPDIPGANRESLVDAFAFALSPSPDERFTTALGFVAALKRALDNAPMHATPHAPSRLNVDEPSHTPVIALPPEGPPVAPQVPGVSEPVRESAGASVPGSEHDDGPSSPPMSAAAPAAKVKPRPARAKPSPTTLPHHDEPAPLSAEDVVPAAAPLSSSTHAAPLEDMELRTRPVDPAAEWEANRHEPPQATEESPRAAPPLSHARGSRLSTAAVVGILAVGALLGLGVGWLMFSRQAPPEQAAISTGSPSAAAAPSQASRPAPPRGVARAEPAGPLTSKAQDAQPPHVAGPSAPAPVPATKRAEPPRRPPATPAPKVRAAAAPVRGQLTVRSRPSGARVEVNGRPRGQTPLTVRDLPLGALSIRVLRDGYGTEQRRVTLTASRAAQALDVPLDKAAPARPAVAPARGSSAKPASEFIGTVFVETRPVGARVFIDGKDVGTSPVAVPGVAAGSHVVRLELAGHKRWTASVSVVAGERNRVAASLEEEEVR